MGDASLVDATPTLRNLSEFSVPMATPLRVLLGQAASGPVQSNYEGKDGDHTLFVQQISGSPWYIASDVPTALLSKQSNAILTGWGRCKSRWQSCCCWWCWALCAQ